MGVRVATRRPGRDDSSQLDLFSFNQSTGSAFRAESAGTESSLRDRIDEIQTVGISFSGSPRAPIVPTDNTLEPSERTFPHRCEWRKENAEKPKNSRNYR